MCLNLTVGGYNCLYCGTFVPVGTVHSCCSINAPFCNYLGQYCPLAPSGKKAMLPSCYEKKE